MWQSLVGGHYDDEDPTWSTIVSTCMANSTIYVDTKKLPFVNQR